MANDKQIAWDNTRRNVEKIVDKLGRPVDPEIMETVIVMRLLGFNTVASCAGHIERVTNGPYVMFESTEAKRFASLARSSGDTNQDSYRKLRQQANNARALDLQQLSNLLAPFYQDRSIDYHRHLIVESSPLTLCRLKCHGAEIARVVDKEAGKEILENNRSEMRVFTEFLKKRYFET